LAKAGLRGVKSLTVLTLSPPLGPLRTTGHRARLCRLDPSSPTLLAGLHEAAQEPASKDAVASDAGGSRACRTASLDSEAAAGNPLAVRGSATAPSEPTGSPSLRRAGASSGLIHRAAFAHGFRSEDVHAHYAWSDADELLGIGRRRVYQARGRHHSSRHVALRQVPRHNADDIDQAWSELGILSELDHPNILRVHEAFEDTENAYVVTELCLGGSLADWLPRVQGDVAFATRVTREIAAALAHCHSHAICHRDLKLESVLLVFDDASSPVRVADFGLAKRCSRRVQRRRLTWAQAGVRHKRSSGKGHAEGEGAAAEDLNNAQPALKRMTSLIGTPQYMASRGGLDPRPAAHGRAGGLRGGLLRLPL